MLYFVFHMFTVSMMMAHVMFVYAFVIGGISAILKSQGKTDGPEATLGFFCILLFILDVELLTSSFHCDSPHVHTDNFCCTIGSLEG